MKYSFFLLLGPLVLGACGEGPRSGSAAGAGLAATAPGRAAAPPAPPLGRTARVTVTFAAPPRVATARISPTLYNKARVLQFEEDDAPVSVFTEVYPLFRGGAAATGQVLPGLRFSDGCGHPRPYTAAVAINGHNPYNNAVWLDEGPGHASGNLTWAQAQTLLDHGWDIENHSDLHTADSPARQLAALDALVADRLHGYQPSVFIVPTNFAGYPTAAFAVGYLAVSSTSQSDALPMLNPYDDKRVLLSQLPAPPLHFVYQRYNADAGGGEPSAALLDRLIHLSNDLLAPGPSAADQYLQRVFTHGIDFNVLTAWMSYTQDRAHDQLWVTTLREFEEYRRTRQQVVKTETLRGNTLTVALDYGGLSPHTRFPNLTLLVQSPGTIASIAVTGADSSSYNKATGLVNIYRH